MAVSPNSLVGSNRSTAEENVPAGIIAFGRLNVPFVVTMLSPKPQCQTNWLVLLFQHKG